MGKKKTRTEHEAPVAERKSLRAGSTLALVALGLGALVGLSAFNGAAKPNRDMQWYVRAGAVEIAAPAVGEGFDTLGGSGDGGAMTLPGTVATDVPTAEPTDIPTPEPTPYMPTVEPAEEAVTLTITAVGDCTLGGQMGNNGYKNFAGCVSRYGYDYFLENVRDLFRSDDLTIVNLEGPLTNATKKRDGRVFNFKGDPSYVSILSGSSVELCNLANNHSLDYGTEGLKETASVLEAAGINYSGFTAAYNTTIKGVRVCSLGFTEWDFKLDDIRKAVAAARKQCDLLIVSMHWGHENKYKADSDQQKLGRAAIDAGADLVLGTHPHVYQGIERYKGKYIVYSLGNFCFGGNADPIDYNCLIFQQCFSFGRDGGVQDAGINIIPASISTSAVTNNFQPVVLPADEGMEVLKSVARYSSNFSMADTLWLPGNYLEESGLMTLNGEAAGTEAAVDEADA